jgi:predicted  nucleic acid-binding Zn-ribbon protein
MAMGKVITVVGLGVLAVAGGVMGYQWYTTSGKLKAANAQIGELNTKVSVIESQRDQVTQRAELLDGQLAAVRVEAEALNKELGTSGNDLKATQAKVGELKSRAEQLSVELAATKQVAEALKLDNTKLGEQLARNESELATSKKLIETLQGQVRELAERVKAKEAELVQTKVAHEAKVAQITTEFTAQNTAQRQVTVEVVEKTNEAKQRVRTFQDDPDARLLGAKIRQFRRSAVGRNDAQKAVGILGGLFDAIGNSVMRGREEREGPQGEPYFAIVFRDGSQQEIAALDVNNWQARIDRIEQMWGTTQAGLEPVQPLFR